MNVPTADEIELLDREKRLVLTNGNWRPLMTIFRWRWTRPINGCS